MKRENLPIQLAQWPTVPVAGFDYELFSSWQTCFPTLALLSGEALQEICQKTELQPDHNSATLTDSGYPASFRWPNLTLHAFFIYGTSSAFLSALIRLAGVAAVIGVCGSVIIPFCLPVLFAAAYVLYKLHGRDISYRERLMQTRYLILLHQEKQLAMLARAFAEANAKADSLPLKAGCRYEFYINEATGAPEIRQRPESAENQQEVVGESRNDLAPLPRSLFNSTTLHTFSSTFLALFYQAV